MSLLYAESGPHALIAPVHLARLLMERMDELDEQLPDAKNPVWTLKVKEFLADIAADLNRQMKGEEVETIFTQSSLGTKEFMLDVVWWLRRVEPAGESVALIAEIEWAASRPHVSGEDLKRFTVQCIGEDFSKLLVVKSPIKLMVFCTDDRMPTGLRLGEVQSAIFEEIERNAGPYLHHVPGEQYVFIDAATTGFRRAWLRTVDNAGTLSQVMPLIEASKNLR